MRRVKYCCFLLGALLCGAAHVPAQAPGGSADLKTVEIHFSAIARGKNPVTTLSKEDILLLEDGVPQRIATLKGREDVPINLLLLLDASHSQEQTMPALREAALSLVNSILRPGTDSALVATFTSGVKLVQPPTGDLQKLRTAIAAVKAEPLGAGGAGGTAIWDGVWLACEHALPLADTGARRVIVVLTDGIDTTSKKTPKEAADRAVRSSAAVYIIRIWKKEVYSANYLSEMARHNLQIEEALAELAGSTGGRAYSAKGDAGLKAVLADVTSEFLSQYRITYRTLKNVQPGQYRRLEIKLNNSAKSKGNIRVTHQRGYYWGDR